MNVAFENFDEQVASETESEKCITKALVHQFSNKGLYNENPILYNNLSHIFSGIIIFSFYIQ